MDPISRTRTLLRERLPKDWDGPFGRIEVDQIRQVPSGAVVVTLRPTDFPVDEGGYRFVNSYRGPRVARD